MTIEPTPTRFLTGEEVLHLAGAAYQDAHGSATAVDFWRWAYSNPRADDIRGRLAEFIVARLLGAHRGHGLGWPHDIDLENHRIEVKSAAYLQDWAQQRFTSIRFSGLRSKLMSPGAGFAEARDFHADIYVFCVLTTKDHASLDPMDLGQWTFYVAARDELASIIGSRDYVSLSLLAKHVPPRPATQLAETVDTLRSAL